MTPAATLVANCRTARAPDFRGPGAEHPGRRKPEPLAGRLLAGKLLAPEECGGHDGGGEYQQDAQKHVSPPFGAGAVRVDVYIRHYGRTFAGTGFFAAPRFRRSAKYKAANGMTRVAMRMQSANA